jgi:chromosome segregation ATPase
MADELTTRPMLEAILEGQRQFAVQLTSLLDAVAALSVKQDGLAARQEQFAARQEQFAARQEQFAARQEELAARQDRLELAVIELTREVRNGFDDTTRKIDVLNSRLLTFETRLKRIDDRLHDEILARTR